MRRRSYLALLASVLGAGCVSDAGVGEGPDAGTETVDRSPDDADPTTTPDGTRSSSTPDHEPFEMVTVGDPASVTDTENARPHTVSLANGGEARTLELAVQRVSPDSDVVKLVVDRSDEFPAGGRLNVKLVEPARYEVVVSVPETGQEARFVVDRRWFDCNASAHNVTVPASGVIEVTEVSTAMACATPGDDATTASTEST